MEKTKKNIAASVHQRLLNEAKKSGRPFVELLQYYAIERFMFRLAQSPFEENYMLKGALMFFVWNTKLLRPTKDVDLLGRIENNLDVVINSMKRICQQKVVQDGIIFLQESISATRITEDLEYKGVRVRIPGNLGTIRLSLQIDIGFGDVIVPKANKFTYPTILGFPAPILRGYSKESTISEKFQAMVKLGLLNSRMKDFYDIWF
jgi:predicted nucleotidyltransferase component of viral defense system